MFVYDYPLQNITQSSNTAVDVENSVINVEPLYKVDGSTTALNMIQQLCTKNHFIFVPFPGDPNSDNVDNIYTPTPTSSALNSNQLNNYFHVMFAPTPETRSKLADNKTLLSSIIANQKNISAQAIGIQFGSPYNEIIKSVSVGFDDTKQTAESIVNLQRLVDNQNQNKSVTTDCSMLSVYEGRSYVATVEMIGNSQVYPMQYFFIDKMPMFDGLYQIMKVKHSIKPNDMTTTLEGIRMRFTPTDGYGGIPPITIGYLESLGAVGSVASSALKNIGLSSLLNNTFSPSDINNIIDSNNLGKITDDFI
jgi:hypothetical protein